MDVSRLHLSFNPLHLCAFLAPGFSSLEFQHVMDTPMLHKEFWTLATGAAKPVTSAPRII